MASPGNPILSSNMYNGSILRLKGQCPKVIQPQYLKLDEPLHFHRVNSNSLSHISTKAVLGNDSQNPDTKPVPVPHTNYYSRDQIKGAKSLIESPGSWVQHVASGEAPSTSVPSYATHLEPLLITFGPSYSAAIVVPSPVR